MELLSEQPENDPRSSAIMEAAAGLFMQYGYSRVSMDDIARAAGMSRPALYQYFRNKGDIYQAIVSMKLAFALEMMRDALAGEGDLGFRLYECIKHGILDMIAEIEDSPHGSELIEMKSGLSGDLLTVFRNRKIAMLSQAYGDAARAAGFEPAVLAEQLADWIEGMKQRPLDPERRDEALRTFIGVQMRAIGVQ
jgi:AcrR family transcriptional regulator